MDDPVKNTMEGMECAGRSSRWGALLLLLAVLAFPAAVIAAEGGGKTASPGWVQAVAAGARDRVAEEKLGIEVVAVRLSEGGNVLDLRYRVVDPAKAHACLSIHVRPYLRDLATGSKLAVPDMPVGALRQTAAQPLAGKVYFMIFWNPGRCVKAGQQVNLVVGDQTVSNLVVS